MNTTLTDDMPVKNSFNVIKNLQKWFRNLQKCLKDISKNLRTNHLVLALIFM